MVWADRCCLVGFGSVVVASVLVFSSCGGLVPGSRARCQVAWAAVGVVGEYVLGGAVVGLLWGWGAAWGGTRVVGQGSA